MPSDEQLVFNTPNSNTINALAQELSLQDNHCDEDNVDKMEQVPWTLEEVNQAGNKIRFALSSWPDGLKVPCWKLHLKALSALKNNIHKAQEQNKIQNPIRDFFVKNPRFYCHSLAMLSLLYSIYF
ncbi:hypothetical protein O181_107576 [Austropuccinia psidii MF-1]|uniref:Uncharacterized protein n=1 Tax=Austropuccinia psidii MF-1 TaxID=1389203 RepID=A0A9Q3PP87_9BASI|nr:hypothetical protein [Austropuccinia psidii MF-1]